MAENNHSETESTPPHAQLVQMAMAHWVSQIVYVAAKLSLADHLAKGPKSADELAGLDRKRKLIEKVFERVSPLFFNRDSRTLWEIKL
jgi:hypothetical protein